MKLLYDEVLRRFPEARTKFNFSEGDVELPYNVMHDLVDWLQRLPPGAFTPELIDRLVSFTRWCEQQPRGKDAGDDLLTILTVGFYENLFDSDTTRALLPRFISRDQFMASADYFRQWVGAEDYEKAGKFYEPAA
jgi:hypothetical protein